MTRDDARVYYSLKSAQWNHSIDTKHIAVNLTLDKCLNLKPFLRFLTKPMKIECKIIHHFCLARQDESIGVKIVALCRK